MKRLDYTVPALIGTSALWAGLNTQAALITYDGFGDPNSDTVNGLDGTGTGFGWASNWDDSNGDTVDRNLGSNLGVTTDLAPAIITDGRTFTRQNTGDGIFRDLSQTFGEDGTDTWVSYRWLSTDNDNRENLRLVDFKRAVDSRGVYVGQVRGLNGDDPLDGKYEIGSSSAGTVDIADRDPDRGISDADFVLLRFNFGAGDADSVDVWWNETVAGFDINTPTASIAGTDFSFNRIAILSSGSSGRGDTMDEIRIGTTIADVTSIPEPTSLLVGAVGLTVLGLRRRRRAS